MAETYRTFAFHNDDLKVVQLAQRTSYINNIDDFPKDFHEEIEIKLFYEGSSTLLVGSESVVTKPGDVIFINPYEFHSTVGFGEQKGKYHLLIVGLDFFQNSRDLLDLRYLFIKEHVRIQTLIRNDPTVSRIVADIVAELCDEQERYETIVRGLMLQLFSLLLRDYKCDGTASYPADKRVRHYEVIYPAIRRIHADYTKKVSVDDLAALCNVSKFHFCRIFKESTTMTAVQYQNECRLQIADTLLKTSDKSVREIAEHCGFDDVCYFSRCYKRRFGVSPIKKRGKSV